METSFTTRVTINPLNEPMGYQHNWLALGSCFAENIGQKLINAGFKTCLNPFGVLFNPLSIEKAIRRLLANEPIREEELFNYGSLWNHFQFSNLHSGTDKAETLEMMNASLQKAFEFLKQTRVLVLTFGTAWIYETRKEGEVVANCHKLPGDRFTRRRLSVVEIVETYSQLLKILPEDIRIVLTVSPVRHWKDGAHENTLSKSTLHLAVEELINQFPARIVYFPAYELVIDELRDYRFYKEDMVHPSDQAIDFVWSAFKEWAFTSSTASIVREAELYRKMEQHRSIHPDSAEHQAFMKKTEQVRKKLQKDYPYLQL